MSTSLVTIARSDALATSGDTLPVASSAVHASARIISSGTSQQSAALAVGSAPYSDPRYYLWRITNGGDTATNRSLPVYLVFGSNPTAVNTGANMRCLLLVGDTFECHAAADGEKVAIIEADVTE